MADRTYDVAALGSLTMDLRCYVPMLPSPGELVYGHTFLMESGGIAPNQGMMARLLGSRVVLIVRRANDLLGREYSQRLADAGVDVAEPDCAPEGRNAVSFLVCTNRGNGTAVVVEAEQDLFSMQALLHSPTAMSALTESRVLILSLTVPLDTVLVALATASRQGVICVLNPSPMRLSPAELGRLRGALGLCHVLCANEAELAALCSRKETSLGYQEVEQCLRQLHADGCLFPIVTLAERGAVFRDVDGQYVAVQAPAVNAVDSIGAGDCFIGCLAHYLAKDRTGIVDCQMVRKAVHLASYSVTKRGTQQSYPRMEDISQILQGIPEN